VSSAKRRAEDAEAAVVSAQKEVQTALSNAEVDRSAVEAAKSAQTDADRRLEELQIELGDLTSKLAAERASAKDTKEHLQGLQIKLDSSLAALAEAEAMTFGVKEERDQARAMRDQLETKVRAVQAALNEADVAKE
jgi:chromosome segregation ATPase